MGTDGNNNPSEEFTDLINLSGGCAQSSCDSGGGLVSVSEGTSSGTVNIPIVKDDGTSVGSVSVPNNPTGDGQSYNVAVSWITNRVVQHSTGVQPASTLVEVNLYDSKGRPVNKFSKALEICIQEESSQVNKDACLGYWDTEKSEWICQDACLESQNDGELWCGTTDHLTSFAILLGGNRGSDPCGGKDVTDYVIAWVSLGLISTAVVVFVLSVLLIEVRYRCHRAHRRTEIQSVTISS